MARTSEAGPMDAPLGVGALGGRFGAEVAFLSQAVPLSLFWSHLPVSSGTSLGHVLRFAIS